MLLWQYIGGTNMNVELSLLCAANVSPIVLSPESATFSDHRFAVPKNKSTGNLLTSGEQNQDASRTRFSFDAGVASGMNTLKKYARGKPFFLLETDADLLGLLGSIMRTYSVSQAYAGSAVKRPHYATLRSLPTNLSSPLTLSCIPGLFLYHLRLPGRYRLLFFLVGLRHLLLTSSIASRQNPFIPSHLLVNPKIFCTVAKTSSRNLLI